MGKKTYVSKFSDKKVTAAQYVAQTMCERKAFKDGIKLDGSFWNDVVWKKFFLYQVSLANNLLKIYPEGAIMQVLGMSDMKWVWSLNTKQFLNVLEKIGRIQEAPEQEIIETTDKRTESRKKTLFDLI